MEVTEAFWAEPVLCANVVTILQIQVQLKRLQIQVQLKLSTDTSAAKTFYANRNP